MSKQFYCTAKLSNRMHKTPEGFLVCQDVAITRTGELQYLHNEVPGITKGASHVTIVERSAEDIFNEETMASFEGKSITLNHPPMFLDSTNYRKFDVGHVQNVRKGTGEFDGKLLADLLVKDESAIKKIETRELREVSCGYNTEYIEIGPGRGRQTEIRGNHLALVPRGRAGPECAIFDSAPKEIKMSLKDKFAKWLDAMPDEGGEEETVDSLKAKLAAFKKKDEDAAADKAKAAKDLATANDTIATLTAAKAAADAALKQATDALAVATATPAAPAKVTHDAATVSAAEILAPGIATDSATLKADALKVAYATADGKAIIDAVTGGTAPAYDNAPMVDMLFRAAAANLTAVRKVGLTPPTVKTGDTQTVDFHTAFAEKAAKVHAIPRF